MGEREIVGRYVLEEPIGRGGMGIVWRAHDRTLQRKVALKEVLLPALTDEKEAEARYRRLEREAQIAGRLSHPGIVTVHDVFRDDDGLPWIVMQYIPSLSLHDLVASQGPLTALRTGRIGQQLLDALAAAHDEGVLHRDVNPRNVLIAPGRSFDSRLAGRTDERAVLTDFGIALFEGDTRLTQADQMFHTAGFTAPERYDGDNVTAASDLWSLGATLFAAVEGHEPFQRNTETATMFAVRRDPPPPARSAGPLLGQLIAALLDRDPSARPSAAAAASMLAENLPLIAGEAGQLSFLAVASPHPIPTAEPALEAESAETAAPGDPQRAGTPPLVLPAPIAPTQTSDPPLQRVNAQPSAPASAPRAPSDPPRSASGLFQELDRETGGSTPAARRVRTRRFARKPVFIIAASLGAAAVAVAVLLLAHFEHGTGTLGSTANKLIATPKPTPSPAQSAAGPTAAVVSAINKHINKIPPGFYAARVSPSALAKTGGFSIDVPRGWQSMSMGQGLYQYTPGGVTYLEIDLAKHTMSSMVSEANYLSVEKHATYPDYQRVYNSPGKPPKPYIQPATILGTAGALWEFDYVSNTVKMRVDVLLFTAGQQSYTITMTSPAGLDDDYWNNPAVLGKMEHMLQTFTPLPA